MLNIIKEKLDILTKQLEKENDLKNRNNFTPEKVTRLSELGLSQVPVQFISNDKPVMLNVSYLLKKSQVKKYLKELEKLGPINFYMHPTFNYGFEDMPDEIEFNLNKNEEILKLIPIVKDIDNPDNINNKFRLGIVANFYILHLFYYKIF